MAKRPTLMDDFIMNLYEGDPPDLDNLETIDWESRIKQPGLSLVDTFIDFLNLFCIIVDNALFNSECSGYDFNSPVLGFPANVTCDKLRKQTGIHKQGLKCFPIKKNGKKIMEIINCYKTICGNYEFFLTCYLSEVLAVKGFLEKNFSSETTNINILRSQILYMQIFINTWIIRYFQRCQRSSLIGEYNNQCATTHDQCKKVEDIIHQFVDGALKESEAEIQLKENVKKLYLDLQEALRAWNKFQMFTEPQDKNASMDGFTLNVDRIYGAVRLHKVIKNFGNLVWKLQSLDFTAGKAVNDNIINVEALKVVDNYCQWNGALFGNVPAEKNYLTWTKVHAKVKEDLPVLPDSNDQKILCLDVEEKDLFLVRPDPVPAPKIPIKLPLEDLIKASVSKDAIPLKEIDDSSESYYSEKSDAPADEDGSGGSKALNGVVEKSKPRKIPQTESGDFSLKLERIIQSIERLVERVKAKKGKTDKLSLESIKSELDVAIKRLDNASVDILNGTEQQWTKIEQLFLMVDGLARKNLADLEKVETDAIHRAQLPKATLEKWSGDVSSFQDWKVHIRKMLKFSDETLNLATLKAHIGDGAEKKTILKRMIAVKMFQVSVAYFLQIL